MIGHVAKDTVKSGDVFCVVVVGWSRHRCKPIVENDMVLRCDGARGKIQNEWCCGGMVGRKSHVHPSL